MVLKAVAIKIVYTFIQCIHISCFFLIKNHKHGTKINVLGAYHKEYMKEKKNPNAPECSFQGKSYASVLSRVVIMLPAEPIAPSFSITTLNHIP